MQTENLYAPDSIRTFTGQYVNVFNPDPETINIYDIAHSLSMQPRFGGHLPEFYSVAQHSLYCARLVSLDLGLSALLHDASEAYLLDVPRPVKLRLTNYKEIEDNLMELISKKFGFEYPLNNDVKMADALALVTEWDCLMLKKTDAPFIKIANQREVEKEFLDSFYSMVL